MTRKEQDLKNKKKLKINCCMLVSDCIDICHIFFNHIGKILDYFALDSQYV